MLKLKYEEKEAEQIIKKTIMRYDNSDREGMVQTKKDFNQRYAAVKTELKKQYKTLYQGNKLALHFFEKTILGSTKDLLRHIAADVENSLDDCVGFDW